MILLSHIVIIMVCLLAAAFFSGMETGVISIHRMRLRHRVKEGEPEAKLLEGFIKDPDRLLGTTLIGTNISVQIASIIGASLVTSYVPYWGEAVSTVLMASLVLVFSEYMPKAWFLNKPMERCDMFAGTLHSFSVILKPVSVTLTSLVAVFGGNASSRPNTGQLLATKDELKMLAREGEQNGVLSSEESKMIHRVFELSAKRAKQIMIPREQVVCIDHEDTVSDFFKTARQSGYTRLPVHHKETKSFTGIINVFDVLSKQSAESKQKVTDFARAPLFIPEDMPVDDILPRLRLSRQPICLVNNRADEVVGLITTEDVLEEIVGQL